MKKVLLIVALIVAYGVAMANVSPKVVIDTKSEVTIVADNDLNTSSIEEDKKKKTKKACCSGKATTAKPASGCSGSATEAKPACSSKAVGEKPSTGCSTAQKKSCAASGKTCSDAATKPAAKSCCSSKK